MRESPFITHREKVLNNYGAARILRSLVLSMWNGEAYPVNLSKLTQLDSGHFAAAMEMMTWYRQHGENDPEFMALALECRTLVEVERRLQEWSRSREAWMRAVALELRAQGARSGMVEDYYSWFALKFDAGLSAPEAASLAVTSEVDER